MSTILVVDDERMNLLVAENILAEEFKVVAVNSAKTAMRYLEKATPDLILLDIKMPEMSGYEMMEIINSDHRLSKIPVIFLTAVTDSASEEKCFEMGAVDFITKPINPRTTLRRIKRTLELERFRFRLEEQVREKTKELELVTLDSLSAVASTIDSKDPWKAGHSRRTAEYSADIARMLGWKEEDVRNLHFMALLHDIGEISISEAILQKPGKLTKREYDLIKKHTESGSEILSEMKMIRYGDIGARHHHERYDGTGYPDNLVGEDIPIYARIITVADAYDAMVHDRAFRSKLTLQEAREELEKGKGTQFDPNIVDAFLGILDRGELHTDMEVQDTACSVYGAGSRLLLKIVESQSAVSRTEATKDYLTGIYNRRYAEAAIQRMLKEVNGAFFLIDIDNFKRVNDLHGHIYGDIVLKSLADMLVLNVRGEDIVYRMGGDEFAIFMSNVDTPVIAKERATKILQDFQKMQFKEPTLSICSLSVGIALSSLEGREFSVLYQKADKALYHVKQNGKNAFYCFNQEDSFVVRKENVYDNTQTDIEQLITTVKNDTMETGVMRVGFRELERVLEFASRLAKRNDQNLQILLFTLQPLARESVDVEQQENLMMVLEHSIYSSLRRVDICARYSSSQYVVILVGTSESGIATVVHKVRDTYRHLTTVDEYEILYDVANLSGITN